jgi:putative addiction module component (TIGR02574 family)
MEQFGIDKLSPEDRLLLADDILESVAEEAPGSTLTPEKRAELRRRVAELDANPTDVVSWEAVQASIRARLGR